MQNEQDLQKYFELIIKELEAHRQLTGQAANLSYAVGTVLERFKDLVLQQQTHELQKAHPNPLNKFGKKCFSQTDEDGITLEIVRRLGIKDGFYAEFGVGDGLENNTLILAALDWKGFWVGGENLAFKYAQSKKFKYIKDWITLENISQLAQQGSAVSPGRPLDVISLDLDGNDIYFVRDLLKNAFLPKLFIVEYNAKFPPPVKFQIDYNPQHQWKGDDYFGASLSSFVELFEEFGYQLVCCNAHTGGNAFFIKKEFMHLFTDVPADINDIYVEPRYFLYTKYGHPPSAKVVEVIMSEPIPD